VNDAPRNVRHRNDANALAIYFADLSHSVDMLEDAERITPRLSPDLLQRYQNRTSVDADEARLWRAAHIALRIALERHTGAGIRGVPYDIEAGGRPRLSSDAHLAARPHFSLAHAGPYALIAISHAGPVGSDLEVTRPIHVSAERRERIERAAARLAPDAPLPETSDDRFLQAWVRLEAVAKATGTGIGRVLTEAGVIGGAISTTAVSLATSCTARDLTLERGCFAAVAGAQLPALFAVEAFPAGAAGLSRFLAASPVP
jgi:4'-phosphopantetheinyl transferase